VDAARDGYKLIRERRSSVKAEARLQLRGMAPTKGTRYDMRMDAENVSALLETAMKIKLKGDRSPLK
jgi:hypothetical protein